MTSTFDPNKLKWANGKIGIALLKVGNNDESLLRKERRNA
jgi:hypothetical protein